MKLTELEPRWATSMGSSAILDGITFLCPHCVAQNVKTQRLGVTFTPPIDPENWWPRVLQPTYAGVNVWKRESGETFETLTLAPSLDFSGPARIDFEGHWHGYIKNGEIT